MGQYTCLNQRFRVFWCFQTAVQKAPITNWCLNCNFTLYCITYLKREPFTARVFLLIDFHQIHIGNVLFYLILQLKRICHQMLYVTCHHSTGHILIYHRIVHFLYFIIVFCYCVYHRPGFLRCHCTIYFSCSLFSFNKNFFDFDFDFPP